MSLCRLPSCKVEPHEVIVETPAPTAEGEAGAYLLAEDPEDPLLSVNKLPRRE